MPNDGIQIGNMPARPLTHVFGVEDVAGKRSTGLQTIEDFVQHLLGLAGLDPSIVAELSTRITNEISRAMAAEARSRKAEVPINGRFTRPRAVSSRLRRVANGFWFSPDTFDGWTIVWVPSRSVSAPAALQVPLLAAANLDRVRLTVYQRPAANLDAYAPGAGEWVGDVQVFRAEYPIASLLPDPLLTNPQLATLPLRGVFGVADMPAAEDLGLGYMFCLEGLTASGAPALLGIAQGVIPPVSATSRDRGWGRTPGGAWFGLGDPYSLPYVVSEAVGVEADDPARPLSQAVTLAERLEPFWPDAGLSTVEAVIPESVVEHAGQTIMVPRQLVVFSKPSEATVTDLVSVQAAEISLTHQYVSGLTVRRYDNDALLTEGVDYRVNYRRVTIQGINSTGVVFANATYTGRKSRYDLVCLDPATGAISVVGGTERGADVGEFMPVAPSWLIPLYSAHVTRQNGVDLIPLQQPPKRALLKGLEWLEYGRQRLPRLRRKMRAGQPIRIAGYGDSITELGGGGSGSGYYTVPNGTYRDTAWQNQGGYFWTGRIGADVVNALPAFDHGDGNPRHVHVGWNWFLKAAIEECSGSTVTYDNWGVGGTNAGQDEPNGLYPPRLNAMTASNPDVVVIEFGMNELGGPFTATRIYVLADYLRSLGIDVIVMGVPLIATPNSVNSIDEWRETNRQLEQGALAADVAFVPVAAFVDPDSPCPLGGQSRRTVSSTNGINHDGPYMLAQYGKLLASLVRGM
ncbi:GDSL-type esterase/lipase family protein [Methylorubrum rhodesianum]|uniref:SGNH/GDSL hydrolase family protein n=1 Tax=Methylorubrum rhodesianum TaxID=29427 RepID=UPI003D2CFC99